MNSKVSNIAVNPYYNQKHARDSNTGSSSSSLSFNPYYQSTTANTYTSRDTDRIISTPKVAINPYFTGDVGGKGDDAINVKSQRSISNPQSLTANRLNSLSSTEQRTREVSPQECDDDSVYDPVDAPQPIKNICSTDTVHMTGIRDAPFDQFTVAVKNGTNIKGDVFNSKKVEGTSRRRQDMRGHSEDVSFSESQAPDTLSTFLKLRADLLRSTCGVEDQKIEGQFDERYMKGELQKLLEQLLASHAEVQALKAQTNVLNTELLNRQTRINELDKCNRDLMEERDELQKTVNRLRSSLPVGEVASHDSSQRNSDTMEHNIDGGGGAKSGRKHALPMTNKVTVGKSNHLKSSAY